GEIWIGGRTNYRHGSFGGNFSDGYIAKRDREGASVWERTFSGTGEKRVDALVPLISSDLIVAGSDDDRTWLGRVSQDGKLMWDRYFGSGYKSAIAVHRNMVFSVGYESSIPISNGPNDNNVVLRRFTVSGDLIDQRNLYDGVHNKKISY